MLKESQLHDYQRTCVKHIIAHNYCGIFLDMGLGKTVSTLTAVNTLMNDYCEINNVLVIAPKRVTETVWQEEAEKWEHLQYLTFSKIIGTQNKRIAAVHKKADVHLISRDNIAWLLGYLHSVRLSGINFPWDMIVIDELSSFKSYKAERFKALRALRPFVKRLVGLTGTPAPNGLIDLWPQIYLMDQGERLGKTISSYRSTYFVPEVTNGGHVVYKYGLLKGADETIHNKIADICISMNAEDYLKMPDRVDNFVKLQFTNELQKQYEEFEKEKVLELYSETYKKVLNDLRNYHEEECDGLTEEELKKLATQYMETNTAITVSHAADLSNKLLQFANGTIYDNDKIAHAIHDIKLDALKEIIDTANGQSVLVAWTYQHDRDRILEYLKSYKPRELKTAQDIKDWNEGKIQVAMAHPASAGHGLNLQAGGNIIVWYSLTWSLELYQQFNARLYRQGQKNTVVINHLIVKDTHDEDVVRALNCKDRQQSNLIASINAKMSKYLTR